MNISVLGCGRWGTFIAWYANKVGHNVILWGRESSNNYIKLDETRMNDYLKLPEDIELSNSLRKAVSFAEIIIISISAQELRSFANQLSLINDIQGKTFILCMKGIEATSGKRLSQVFSETVGNNTNIAVWVGPGHVQDFVNNLPNCMVIDSEDIEITKKIV
ncbi:NAD(P)-binding domain-containing protein [Priestia megaterium]|uniref:NAD(P)-binding domain-containing protein n=1 Tax=Priestia megaterium TaxID=1404 RepID=UPI00211D6174|nr:NAD(P)-binding domain-containing protein [Priestia megaterium]